MFARLLSVASLAALVATKILYAGVNESGGEFGVFSNNATLGFGLPGRFNQDFAFINKSTVDIFVRDDKINFFRVAFLMERMCPVNLATGKGLGRRFNETYFSEFKNAIDYITLHHEKFAMLDPHNYMRYNDPSQQPNTGSVIGDTNSDPRSATTEQFEEFWFELALRFRNNPRVIFGLMNEPHDMSTALLLKNDQAAVNGIRRAGAPQLILAPGNGFTGGHSWTQASQGNAPSSEFMARLRDPLHNLAIEVHEYLDEDFSGSHAECTQPGPSNLANLTTWLRENRLKAFVGEFGAGNNDNCRNFVGDLLDYLAANDEYIGWSMWAAGPLWGTFRSCCGDDTGNLEPGTLTDLGTPGAYESVWIPAVRPRIPKGLKKHGVSSLHL